MHKYVKKGAIVFVVASDYPPWPAEVERKNANGHYKVNFYGEKSYTTIQMSQIQIFTEARAKQVIQELNIKHLNKSVYLALKQLENKKKKLYDEEMISYLEKNALPLLKLDSYKDHKYKQDNAGNNSAKQVTVALSKQYSNGPSSSELNPVNEIITILEKIYDFIVSPVDKSTPILQFQQKKEYFQKEFEKLQLLFAKLEKEKQPEPQKVNEKGFEKKNEKGGKNPSQMVSSDLNSSFESIISQRLVEKIILTIKAYESFIDESKRYFSEMISFLKIQFTLLEKKYRKFHLLEGKKKIISAKDRIILKKFQDFQAYL